MRDSDEMALDLMLHTISDRYAPPMQCTSTTGFQESLKTSITADLENMRTAKKISYPIKDEFLKYIQLYEDMNRELIKNYKRVVMDNMVLHRSIEYLDRSFLRKIDNIETRIESRIERQIELQFEKQSQTPMTFANVAQRAVPLVAGGGRRTQKDIVAEKSKDYCVEIRPNNETEDIKIAEGRVNRVLRANAGAGIGVKKVKTTKSHKVIVAVESEDLQNRVLAVLQTDNMLNQNCKIAKESKLWPKIKLKGVTAGLIDDYDKDDPKGVEALDERFLTNIRVKNRCFDDYPTNEDLIKVFKPVYHWKPRPRYRGAQNDDVRDVMIVVEPTLRAKLNDTLYSDNMALKITDAQLIKQCFKCYGFGHKADSPRCTLPQACSHCAGPHKYKDCPQTVRADTAQKRCIKCIRAATPANGSEPANGRDHEDYHHSPYNHELSPL